MRVVLVGPDLEENLSLRYLMSSLHKAGHQATLAAFDSMDDFSAVLALAGGADLVGLSLCYQVRAKDFLALAAALKATRPNQPVVAGGHYASCAARDLIRLHPELDAIAIAEAERTIVELANLPNLAPARLATVPGLVYREGEHVVATPPRPALAELDALPWPDRTGPARLMSGVPTAYMMGSRGCLNACDYCCISALHRMVDGPRFRQRSPLDIVEEMASLYHQRGVRQFIFHDDNFLVPSQARNLERIDALDRGIRERRMRRLGLALKCRPADVNREVFLRLREMGLLRVFLGIESGSAAGLSSIGRRQTVEEEHRALDICQDLGISTQYTIILFHPEATLHSMREDLAFVRRHPRHPMSYCRAEIYAGTPLEKRMIGAGRAYGDYLARAYHYSDPLTTLAWSAASDLLRERCFSQGNLLGRIIRLDHQAAVLRHFYDGASVDDLCDSFTALEVAANLDTAALMGEIFDACQAHPSLDSAELRARLADLGAREQVARHKFEAQACTLREAMTAEYAGVIDHAQRVGWARRLDRLPLHAAAVVLAMSMVNCDGNKDEPRDASMKLDQRGMNEMAPTPLDAAVEDGRIYLDERGMIEAPPPPVDAPIQTGEDGGVDATPDASLDARGGMDATPDASLDAQTDAARDTRTFVDQGGMIEAPPPPVDARGKG